MARSDGTRDALDALAAGSALLTILHADRNRGKGHAVRLGLARARGTVVAIQDADLELDPAQLADLVDADPERRRRRSSTVHASSAARPDAPAMTVAGNRCADDG